MPQFFRCLSVFFFLFSVIPNARANEKNALSLKSIYPKGSFMLLDVAANINQGGNRFLYGPGVEVGLFVNLWSSKRFHSSNVHHVSVGVRGSYHYGLEDDEIKDKFNVSIESRFYTFQALLRYMSPSTKDNLYSFVEAGYAYSVAQYSSEVSEETLRQLRFFPGKVDHLFKGSLGLGYSFEEFFKVYIAASVMANRAHTEGFGSLGFTLGL